MLENLKKLKDINNKLRRQIRHRIGEGGLELDDLSFQQLRSLEDDMVSSIAKIRDRKVPYNTIPLYYGSSNFTLLFSLTLSEEDKSFN